jgi:hypothetical protein
MARVGPSGRGASSTFPTSPKNCARSRCRWAGCLLRHPTKTYAVSRSAADASPPRMQAAFDTVRARRQRPARPSPEDQSEPEPAAPPPTIKRPYHGRPDFSVPDEQSLAVAMATARHRGRPPAGEVRTPSWLDRRGNIARGVLGFPSIEWVGLTIEASSCRTKTRAKSA